MRGVLGSTVVFSCNIGMLIAFTVGAYCDFGVIPKMMTVLTILSTVSLIFFPETPSVLLKQDKIAVSRTNKHKIPYSPKYTH